MALIHKIFAPFAASFESLEEFETLIFTAACGLAKVWECAGKFVLINVKIRLPELSPKLWSLWINFLNCNTDVYT